MAGENGFTATSRIPTRPLSYQNRDLAEPKEIVVDYEKHEIYVMDENKNLVNVTASVDAVVKEMQEQFEKDPTIVTNVKIELPDGSNVTIDKSIYDIYQKFADLEKDLEKLGMEVDEQGKATIDASSVKTTDDNQFVSAEEKTKWNAKADIVQMNATVASGDAKWTATADGAPYTQEVTVKDMSVDYYPVVDVQLSDDYETAMKELTSYAYIYKITTENGKIKIYSIKPTEVDLNIVMKVDK